MEQVTKETIPFAKESTPFTKEAVRMIMDGTITSEQAAALFNVDPLIFKARLQQFHFFARKLFDGSLLDIHGGDHEVSIVLQYMWNGRCAAFYTMHSTVSLQDVICLIKRNLNWLSHGCPKLTFKHPNKLIGNVVVKTDRDWHMVLSFSRSRGYYVYLDLEFFPSNQTANEVSYDEVAYDEVAWFMPLWDPSYEDPSYEDASDDEDSCDEDSNSFNVFVEDARYEAAYDENSMEPLTKEAILSLNNGSVTFEQARAYFNVHLSTFKERLAKLNIFVWKEGDGSLVRIHGGDYEMTIVIKTVQDKYYFTVRSTDTFGSVISMIEEYLKLSPGCYKLTFKHPQKSYGNQWIKTDRDWHFAVFFSSFGGYLVYLDLEVFPTSQTARLSIKPDC